MQCRWQISPPFSITPEAASIEAGQAVLFDVVFCPAEASVYTMLAACQADTGYTATIKVCSCRHPAQCETPLLSQHLPALCARSCWKLQTLAYVSAKHTMSAATTYAWSGAPMPACFDVIHARLQSGNVLPVVLEELCPCFPTAFYAHDRCLGLASTPFWLWTDPS